MKKITLKTKEELNIYMNHTRQKLLRQLNIENAPMTPKMLADKLQISASGIQHHIKKLMSLGLLVLDHTEVINGITASFYKPTQVTVQVGLSLSDDLTLQREVLIQDSIANVYDGFRKYMKMRLDLQRDKDPDSLQKWGDIQTGFMYLSKQESEELMKLITAFLEQHAKPSADSSPWEYAFIAYNTQEVSND